MGEADSGPLYDKRRYRRMASGDGVRVELSGKTYRGELKDISLEGALLRCTALEEPEDQTPLRISFTLPGLAGELTLQAQCLYHAGDVHGLRFQGENMLPLSRLRDYLLNRSTFEARNRRRFLRVPLEADAQIETESTTQTARVKDISVQGVLVWANPPCDADTRNVCTITIITDTGYRTPPIRSLQVYRYEDTMGFKFLTRDAGVVEALRCAMRS